LPAAPFATISTKSGALWATRTNNSGVLLAEIRSRSLVERVSTLIDHDPDISKTKLVAQIQAVDSTVGTKEIRGALAEVNGAMEAFTWTRPVGAMDAALSSMAQVDTLSLYAQPAPGLLDGWSKGSHSVSSLLVK